MTNSRKEFQPKFELANFLADPSSPNVSRAKVGLVKSYFQLHPDPKRIVRDMLVYTSKETGWMLVDHEVLATKGWFPGIWRADLYEGMKSNGTSFLYPVTRALDGNSMSGGFADAFDEVYRSARVEYVKVVARRDYGCWEIAPADKQRYPKPVWPRWSVEAMVETLFDGQILDLERAQALGQLSRRSRNCNDIDESYD